MGPGHFGRGSSLPGVAPCCAGEILKIQLGSYTRGHWVDQGVDATTRPDSVNVTFECKEFSHLALEDKHTTVPGTAMDGGILLWFRVVPDPYLLKNNEAFWTEFWQLVGAWRKALGFCWEPQLGATVWGDSWVLTVEWDRLLFKPWFQGTLRKYIHKGLLFQVCVNLSYVTEN